MHKNILPISKEGMNNISYLIAITFFFVLLDFDILSLLSFILLAGLLYIYRNPEREIIASKDVTVVVPVDGKVLSLEEIEDDYYAYKVVLESNFNNIGVLRTPMNSTILSSEAIRGSKLSLNSTNLNDKLNENATIIFEDAELNKIKVEHTLKNSLNNITINSKSGFQSVEASRYGFMLNGITTIYLPKNFTVNISAGLDVIASQTILGSFKK